MRCETAELRPLLLNRLLHEPLHIPLRDILIFGIRGDGHALPTDADIVPFRPSGCDEEAALIVGELIRFFADYTWEKSKIVHRHRNLSGDIGVQRLLPIVVGAVRRRESEQIGVKFKGFDSILRVEVPRHFVILSIAVGAAETPHHLLEPHRDTIVFLAIPRGNTIEVLLRTREKFGDVAKLRIRFGRRERVAVFRFKRRHLARVFKKISPVDVTGSIHLRRQCPILLTPFRIFGERCHRRSVDRRDINIGVNPFGEIDVVSTDRIPPKPLAIADDDVVKLAFPHEGGKYLILKVRPRYLDDIDRNPRFGRKILGEFGEIIRGIPFGPDDGEGFLRVRRHADACQRSD